MANRILNTSKRRPIAYPGKYVDVNGKDFFLVMETDQSSCKGCAFLNTGCDANRTSYCTQGYIFKEVILDLNKK